jgi:hypothetical protein
MNGWTDDYGRGGGAGSHPVFVALLVAVAFGAGCRSTPPDADATARGSAADPTPSPTENAMADTPSDSLRIDLIAPAQVAAGEPVEITLRVENVAGRPLDLYLMGRTIAFDLIVEDEAGTEIWSRLHDQVLQQILRVEHLAPGDTLTLEDTWPQRSNAGSPVPPGAYRVRGEVFTEQEPLTAGPAPLRIAGD